MIDILFEILFCIVYGLARWRNNRQFIVLLRLLCITLLLLSTKCGAQYIVEVLKNTISGYEPVVRCDATGADFGEDIADFSLAPNSTGCASFVSPRPSCSVATIPKHEKMECLNYFAVIPRHNCTFSEKAYYAQSATPVGFRAALIYNDEGYPPIPMRAGAYAELVGIPVLMVSYVCMKKMMFDYTAEDGYIVALRAIPGYFELVKYLVPLLSAIGFCFIVLIVLLIVRLCRERRRTAHKRLSKRNLKKIPIKKFRKGSQPETCSICLDDFQESEKIRILPCNHVYHCKCIDPWLTKNRKVCPICKRKVFSSGDSDSSDSDLERNPADPTSSHRSSTTHENAPLLNNEQLPLSPDRLPTGFSDSNLLSTRQVLADVHADSMDPTDGEQPGVSRIDDSDEPNIRLSDTIRHKFRPILKRFINITAKIAKNESPTEVTHSSDSESHRGAVNNVFDHTLNDENSREGQGVACTISSGRAPLQQNFHFQGDIARNETNGDQ